VPSSRDVCRTAPRLGNDLTRHEKSKLDADTGEPDTFAAPLRARRDVVVACEVSALHAAAVINDRQRRDGRVGQEANASRTGVERVRDDLGEDRLFKGAGVGVPQVFEEVLEVDSGFYRANESSATTPVRCTCAASAAVSAR